MGSVIVWLDSGDSRNFEKRGGGWVECNVSAPSSFISKSHNEPDKEEEEEEIYLPRTITI